MYQLSYVKDLFLRSTFQVLQKAGVGVQELLKDTMFLLLSDASQSPHIPSKNLSASASFSPMQLIKLNQRGNRFFCKCLPCEACSLDYLLRCILLIRLQQDTNSYFFESEGCDHSDLTLEAAKAKWIVHEAEKHLVNCILEHQTILVSLWHYCAEAEDCCLLSMDLNVRCMQIKCKESGIATFTRSDSGLVVSSFLLLLPLTL